MFQNEHNNVVTPYKKPPKQKLDPREQLFNACHSVYRARIEHTFGGFKRRFLLFSQPLDTHDIYEIEILFKLCAIIHAHHSHELNKIRSKYKTCCNVYWRETRVCPKFDKPGNLCDCIVFKDTEGVKKLKAAAKKKTIQKKKLKAVAKKKTAQKPKTRR